MVTISVRVVLDSGVILYAWNYNSNTYVGNQYWVTTFGKAAERQLFIRLATIRQNVSYTHNFSPLHFKEHQFKSELHCKLRDKLNSVIKTRKISRHSSVIFFAQYYKQIKCKTFSVWKYHHVKTRRNWTD